MSDQGTTLDLDPVVTNRCEVSEADLRFSIGVALRPASAGEWWERAACRGLDTLFFFPTRGESTAEAEAVCATCEVREDCLWFALGDNGGRAERFGIWGGSSERQRRRLRRQRRAAEEVAS